MENKKELVAFIVPSESYSPIVLSTNKYGGLFKSEHYSPMKEMGDSYQHLYIASAEEVKMGDCYIWMDNKQICVADGMLMTINNHVKNGHIKKINFTTNNSLEIGTNNCDGCLANKPIEKGYLHRMGESGYADFMSCQKSKYITKLPEPSAKFIQDFIENKNNSKDYFSPIEVKLDSL